METFEEKIDSSSMNEEEQKKMEKEHKEYSELPKFSFILAALVLVGFFAWDLYAHSDKIPSVTQVLQPALLGLYFITGYCIRASFRLGKNIKNGEFFTKENAKIISRMASVVRICLMFIVVAGEHRVHSWLNLTIVVPILLGGFLDLVSYMVRRGIQMQEEQSLTI
jgi:hypothetical protein